jgi:hypothetical protein
VVVNQSHEGKPHLAGAVLMLGTALAGSIYVETGKRSTALLTGALCGAATGMILSCYPIFLILPMMVILRRSAERGRAVRGRTFPLSRYSGGGLGWGPLTLSLIAGIGVYCVTNPYVPINLVCNREVLRSNLGTSAAMYHAGVSLSSLRNAGLLIINGAGALTAIGGAIGAVFLGRRALRMLTASPGTPGEGGGEGLFAEIIAEKPSPYPSPGVNTSLRLTREA